MAGTALIGAGFIGPVHVEALRRIGRPVVGVLGSNPSRTRQAAESLRIPKAYESLHELLDDGDIDAIHVASPNRDHFDACRLGLIARKHVICEKPLAMDPREADELVRLADASPGLSAVCYNVRFYPLCLEARERIRAGELGDIVHITGSYVQDWLLFPNDFNWRVTATDGGELRAVADIGTHWLDLAQFITGQKVRSVCADLQTVWPTRGKPSESRGTFQGPATSTERTTVLTEDYASVLLRFREGAHGCFTVSQTTAGRKNASRFEIAGTKGSLAWNSERPNELWIGRRDRPSELLLRDPALLSPLARRYSDYPGGHNEGFPDTFKQLFRSIYTAIDAGVPLPPETPTFRDGRHEIRVCQAIMQSHRTGGWTDVGCGE